MKPQDVDLCLEVVLYRKYKDSNARITLGSARGSHCERLLWNETDGRDGEFPFTLCSGPTHLAPAPAPGAQVESQAELPTLFMVLSFSFSFHPYGA